jgi:hypothetical protein
MDAAEVSRKLAAEFKGTLSEKDALEGYVKRTLESRPLTDENIEYYSRLGVNWVRSLSGPQPEFG